jgi:hypothetical protein
MVKRAGGSKLGCLVSLVFVGAVIYFGVNIGGQAWKYYEFKDAMQQEARHAASRSDDVIKRRLQTMVDSLGLPEGAKNIRVKRTNNMIFIWTEYFTPIEFPGFVKEINFSPQAQSPF